MPLPGHFSSEMKQMISKLLTVDEKQRPSINELLRTPILADRIRKLLSD
jgi:NIMA (never in mitosis gene a)-related kinase